MNSQPPASPPPDPPDAHAPAWVKIVGVCFLGLAVLFFMGLVIAAVFGHSVPSGARFLVCVVLALCVGMGAAFLGGSARAEGKLPFPHILQNPVSFGVTGGVAVVVIVLLVCHFIYKEPEVTVPRPSVTNVTATREGSAPAIVILGFQLDSLPPQHKLVAQIATDKTFQDVVRIFVIDNFATGEAILAVNKTTNKYWVRLIVQSPDGNVATQSDPMEFEVKL